MRVAAIQSDIAWEDPPANFRRLAPWIAAAAGAGARLVALPEMFACGFTMEAERVAEPPGGPSTRFLQEQAAAHDVWLAGSLPELPPGAERPFNTLVLAAPDGALHRYRKIHPFTYAAEHLSYGAGQQHVTVEVDDLALTLFICYDLRFADELWATAPVTDAYLVVANWPVTRRQHWTALLTARAIENQAYVIGVNRVGEGDGLVYGGDSRIVDPMGQALATAAGQESLLLADLEAETVRRVRRELPFLPDRRG